MKLNFVYLALVALAGCAQLDKTVMVKIRSLPEGAVIYSRGTKLAISPTVGEAHVTDEQIARRKAWNSFTAVLKSGATSDLDIGAAWVPGDRRSAAGALIRRPDDAPGLPIDLQYVQERTDGPSFAEALFLGPLRTQL
jgi:hypothetical protein